jgi:phospholipase C
MSALDKIEHIVVVMFENRSFDNLLGWLYDPSNEPPFDKVPPGFEGLSGKDLKNFDTSDPRVAFPVSKTEDVRGPQPNPGEPFEDVFSQIYDVNPTPNLKAGPLVPPPSGATMGGFIRNYAAQTHKPLDPSSIMQCLVPKSLPVLSTLAHNFAVCDHWFASIPTQTFCNRSYVHAGTSSGYVNNWIGLRPFVNESTTIFDLLEEANRSWQVIFGGWLLQSFTLLTQRPMWRYARTEHFAHFKEFINAANNGALPAYSFIEPIYFDSLYWGPQNDMHPECNPYEFYGPANLHRGEALLAKIYNALRNGPNWEKTMLIVVFDEHGGCYDHVSPPTAASGCKVAINPDGKVIRQPAPGGSGFNFDRLGPRVPAILISPYTKPQTLVQETFEHTTILRTIRECFGLPSRRLGDREAVASDLSAALNLDQPRPAASCPEIDEPRFSLFDDLKTEFRHLVHRDSAQVSETPISELQLAALHGIAELTGNQDLPGRIGNLSREHEADLLLAELETAFTGRIPG